MIVTPIKGRYKGRKMKLKGRVPGTEVFKAKVYGKEKMWHTCYLHRKELHILDRLNGDRTLWSKLQGKLWVKWHLLLLDLAGADVLLTLNEEGEEFLYAKRPAIARFLFPGTAILHHSQPLP